jgi:hypothetical protein
MEALVVGKTVVMVFLEAAQVAEHYLVILVDQDL